ncbi:MAG: tRNA pseudouridine(55) synthase TruB [Methylovulum sp.]|jgi:tRNA pseudouridine55 synthase|nr:tRNA pseudouridine(55) synthase TruB [Methylovulum sp.]
MGKRKSGRDLHGILLLDKRLGVSSNRALQEVKRLMDANKAGHTGSLDPLATGLLPLCFGEATKVSAFMLNADKRYEVTVQLGVVTDTGDAEGQVIQRMCVPALTIKELNTVLQSFIGVIEQVPPMYSALKHNGKKLYELAREGIVIDRIARKVEIKDICLQSYVEPNLKLEVSCSKGTYIRTLAEDIGQVLGCGGTVIDLRRTASGQFSINNALTLAQLQSMNDDDLQSAFIAVDAPLMHFPAVLLLNDQAKSIGFGQPIFLMPSSEEVVRLYHNGQFLGLGERLSDGKILPKKLFNLNKIEL